MRYDTPVLFHAVTGVYDPQNGTWSDVDAEPARRWANVTPMSREVQRATFGDWLNTRLVIRLRQIYTDDFQHVTIPRGKYAGRYVLDLERTPQDRHSIVVIREGSQNGG